MARNFGLWIGIALLLVLFLALNITAGLTLRGARIDATEGSVYTLTQGSRNIAKSPAEPVNLTYYYSAKAAKDQPGIAPVAQRVRELLQEYERASAGKIVLTIVDPEPFSEAEDKAMESGLQGFPLTRGGDTFYFGLVGTNSVDTRETINLATLLMDSSRERLLEYDISRLISNLATPNKPVVGWISPLQLEGGYRMNPRTRQPEPTEIYQVMRQMKSTYEVRRLDTTITAIPDDITILMVVHPKELPEGAQYAIDQFVLKGGRLMLFVDPLCEADEGQDQFPTALGRASSLPRLLSAWGVEVAPDTLAVDQDIAARVTTRASRDQVPYILWLVCENPPANAATARPASLNSNDAVTGQVRKVLLASAGFVKPTDRAEGDTTPRPTLTPLITTGPNASTMLVESVQVPAEPMALFSTFVPGNQTLTLAARLSGPASTAFPEGPPANADGAPMAKPEEQLKVSTDKGIQVLVFADADVVTDAQWVRVQQLGPGLVIPEKLSDNGELVLASVDNLSGSTDLMAVRSRPDASRPFTKVEEIQQVAQQQYARELANVDAEMAATQQKLATLQAQRGGDQSGGLVLTEEQQKELAALNEKLIASRKSQRELKHNLSSDIERLGVKLLWINTALVPGAIIVAAIIIAVARARRRTAA